MSATLLFLVLATQNLPPELRTQRTVIDPVLPEVLRPAVAQASEAELDPKRGTGNAIEILKAERKKREADPLLATPLDLRIAATVLRARFSTNVKVAEPARFEQALSTFSRLDLTEPGFAAWLQKALEKHSELDAKYKGPKGTARTIPVAVLIRGSGLDKKAAFEMFEKGLAPLGFKLTRAEVKDAAFVIKLAADDQRADDGSPAVRVTLEVERPVGGKVAWNQSLYRTVTSKNPASAVVSALDWLVRVGGRDMLFQWLKENGLENAVMALSQGHDHAHEGSMPSRPGDARAPEAPPVRGEGRVSLPKGGVEPPPPPAPKKGGG